MKSFFKTIKGQGFEFKPEIATTGITYHVTAENYKFRMSKEKNAVWKIQDSVPLWVRELEEDMGHAIEAAHSPADPKNSLQ